MFKYVKRSNENEISRYLKSNKSQSYLYKRTIIIITIAQVFSGVGITAGVMVGACGVVFSAIYNNIYSFFIFLFIYGFGTATSLQVRYAGTDLATKSQMATAVSMALVSTTLGAVFSPYLVQFTSSFATNIGSTFFISPPLPPLTIPFILASIGYFIAALVIFLFLRPDSFLVSKYILKKQNDNKNLYEELKLDKKGVALGTTIMIFSQFIMIALMTMTPIYMKANGFGLKEISLVIGVCILALCIFLL